MIGRTKRRGKGRRKERRGQNPMQDRAVREGAKYGAEKTKEVLQEWPLTTVKRWAASPKSFTLVGTG